MACFIGEDDFPPEVLQYSRLASKYFDTDCKCFPPSDKSTECHVTEWIQQGTFTHSLPLRYYSIEGQINMAKKLARREDVKSTAEIVLRCLELNPNDRPTAAELLNDPWFLDVD